MVSLCYKAITRLNALESLDYIRANVRTSHLLHSNIVWSRWCCLQWYLCCSQLSLKKYTNVGC